MCNKTPHGHSIRVRFGEARVYSKETQSLEADGSFIHHSFIRHPLLSSPSAQTPDKVSREDIYF